jgi:hypothetical protein
MVMVVARGTAGANHETSAPAEAATIRSLYLAGRPQLKDFTRHVRDTAIEPPRESALAATWQAAADMWQRLAVDEAGAADAPEIRKLGREYDPLLVELLHDPLIQHGFNNVPSEVALVELDKLVVYQRHIDLSFVERLEQRVGTDFSDDAVFRFCLLHEHTHPPVRWSRVGDDKYVFVSPSNDLRYLGAMPLEPAQIRDYPPPGDLAAVVGAGVGFGSNFLNAVLVDGRLILHNGSHRAYTLHKLGVTHAPCIVQHVSTRAELELVAPSRVRSDTDAYLKHPRPSMLRDYRNPELHVVLESRPRVHTVTVRLRVEQDWVPAL